MEPSCPGRDPRSVRGPGGGEGSPRVLLFQFSTGPKGIRVPGAGSWGEGSPDPRGLPLAWKDACCRAAARPVDPGTSDAGAAACRLRGGLCYPVSSASEEGAHRPRQRGVAGVLSRASSECLRPPCAPLGSRSPSREETEVQGAPPSGPTSQPRGPGLPTLTPCRPHAPARRSSQWVRVGAGLPQTSAPRSEVLPSLQDRH